MLTAATSPARKRASGDKQLEEFARLRDQQAGYHGTVTVEAGDDRTLSLALWESKEQQEAASAKLAPEAERLMGPLWTIPARILGSGEVSHNGLTKA